jgi:hypothetical protein
MIVEVDKVQEGEAEMINPPTPHYNDLPRCANFTAAHCHDETLAFSFSVAREAAGKKYPGRPIYRNMSDEHIQI